MVRKTLAILLLTLLNTICILFFLFSSVYGQDMSDYAKRMPSGEYKNQDYFVANQSRRTRILLKAVEGYHLNEKVIANVFSGNYESALSDLKYTLNRFPNHPKALLLMSSVAIATEDQTMATLYYVKALRLYPQYALTYAQFGEYLVEIGQVREGFKLLRKAIEIDPKLPLAYEGLAKAHAKNGNQELSRKAAETARRLRVKTPQ